MAGDDRISGEYEWTETLGNGGYLEAPDGYSQIKPVFYNSEKKTYIYTTYGGMVRWHIGPTLGSSNHWYFFESFKFFNFGKYNDWIDPNTPCPADINYEDRTFNPAPEISVTVTKASDPDNVVPKPSTEQPKTTSTKTTTKTTTKSTTTTTTTTETATTTTVEDTEDTTEGSI